MNARLICLFLALVSLALLPAPSMAHPGHLGDSPRPGSPAEYVPAPLTTAFDCGILASEPYPVGPPLPPPVSITLSPEVMRLVHPPVDVHEFDWIW